MSVIQDLKTLTDVARKLPGIRREISNIVDKMGFRYLKYSKHITIYPNGHGIQISTYTIKILDKVQCDYIYRASDLNDACKDFKFSKMEEMQRTDCSKRFEEIGFWFESENDFISRAQEFYWSETNQAIEDQAFKADEKHMRWRFIINQGKIENNRNYDFNFVMSIPNMFPITDGKFDAAKQPYDNYDFNSVCTCDSKVDKMKYILSFERGIVEPEFLTCTYHDRRKQIPLPPQKENNYIYHKYIVKHKNLNYHNKVHYRWQLPPLNRG